MKKSEQIGLHRVPSNLLQQNCFVRDITKNSQSSASPLLTFDSLDEVTTERGVEFRVSENPYPITPQYVNSFADSSDYRRDPVGAVNNSHNRVNLGDITDFQKVVSMDMTEARTLYSQLRDKFSKSEVSKSNSESEVPKSDSEVINNG